MKTRTGFVSNSSTSSFLIFGTKIPYPGVPEMWELSRKANLFGLTFAIPYETDIYLGLSWAEVRDDETGAQFKERAKDKILQVYPEATEFSTHGAAWHD